MKTRCKFKCTKVEFSGDVANPDQTVHFEAVTSGSPENESFFHWTPSGRLQLGLVRQGEFVVGKEYFLDIIPCDEDERAS